MWQTDMTCAAVAAAGSAIYRLPVRAIGVLDGWMFFGFIAAVLLLTSFMIRRRSLLLLGCRTACAGSLAVYGFAAGAWPLGIVLAVACLRHAFELGMLLKPARRRRRSATQFPIQSRISRMFDIGSSLADWDAGPTRSKPPHDNEDFDGALN